MVCPQCVPTCMLSRVWVRHPFFFPLSVLWRNVQAHPLAGTAWDEAFMQVGALQMAWLFFVLGAELQGNVEAGRYKRIMTWMINLPVVVFMIGNMILAARRNGDGVETSSGMAVNMVVGAVFIVLSIACTVIYAADDDYKNEKWLVLVSQVQPLSRHAQPTGPRSFHNNRFMPQFILHLAAMGCLMYFAIIGLHHYDLDQGWLLTDAYKSDAEAVNAWDKASASVGMGAVPLMFMLFGFELQGDLAPYNFKPLAVFVGCLNIFISSIFLYVTTTAHEHPVGLRVVLTGFIAPPLCPSGTPPRGTPTTPASSAATSRR